MKAEEEEYARLEAEEETRLAEEARLKSEEEYQAWLKSDKEARLSEEARQKAEEHKRARLKIEEGFTSPLKQDGEPMRRISTHI